MTVAVDDASSPGSGEPAEYAEPRQEEDSTVELPDELAGTLVEETESESESDDIAYLADVHASSDPPATIESDGGELINPSNAGDPEPMLQKLSRCPRRAGT